MACENEFEENVDNLRKLFYFNKIVTFQINQLTCTAGSNSGDNYMSVVKRVHVIGALKQQQHEVLKESDNLKKATTKQTTGIKTDEDLIQQQQQQQENENEKEEQPFYHVTFILKRQIPSISRRRLYRCDEAFSNEINAYNHVVPLLLRYSSDIFFPKCHFAGKDDFGELIVLEDLKQHGLAMHNRLAGLDLSYCKLVMKNLAKLHAASIAAKHMEKDIFHEKCKHLHEIVYNKEAEEFYRCIVENSVEEALNSLRQSNVDGCLTEPIRLIEQLHTKLYYHIQNRITNSKESLSVVCHGDLWVNNIMFTPVSTSSVLIPSSVTCTCNNSNSNSSSSSSSSSTSSTTNDAKVRFFDLQAMRYTSPVFDILHFIYTSTQRDLRDAYTNTLLDTYCCALAADLESKFPATGFDTQLNSLRDTYSLSNITDEYYEHVLYGLVISMWILPAVTFDPNHIPNLDAISETNTNGKSIKCTQMLTPEFHTRIKDVALEFYQNGFLSDKPDKRRQNNV